MPCWIHTDWNHADMPARLAPDQSRGYLIAIGTTVRGAGETGIFKRIIGLIGDRANIALIAAAPDDSTIDDVDTRLMGNGAHQIPRVRRNKRSDCDPPSGTATIKKADLVLLCADQPLRIS